MVVEVDAHLIIGWPLKRENIRKLARHLRPEINVDNQQGFDKAVLSMLEDWTIGWKLDRGGGEYTEPCEEYYLALYLGPQFGDPEFDVLVQGMKKYKSAGRKLATKIGVPEYETVKVYACGFIC